MNEPYDIVWIYNRMLLKQTTVDVYDFITECGVAWEHLKLRSM